MDTRRRPRRRSSRGRRSSCSRRAATASSACWPRRPACARCRDVGGSSLNQVPTYRVFGQAGEAYSTLEGVQTSSLQASSGQANYWDYTTHRGGGGPDHRQQRRGAEPGRQSERDRQVRRQRLPQQHVARTRRPSSTQSDNIDDELRAQGITRRHGHRQPLQRQRRPGRPHHPGQALVLHGVAPADRRPGAAGHVHAGRRDAGRSPRSCPGSTPTRSRIRCRRRTSSSASTQYNHKYDTSNLSQFIPWEHRGGLMTPSQTGKIEWQKVYGSKLVTSFQYGFWTYDSHYWSFSPREFEPRTDRGHGNDPGAADDDRATSAQPPAPLQRQRDLVPAGSVRRQPRVQGRVRLHGQLVRPAIPVTFDPG